MHPSRILRRSLVVTTALTVLLVAPAGAHPFIAGGELPVDSLATMRLSMAHGCGGDDGGDEAVTTEVALEVPDWLRVVEVPAADGYVAATEAADDGTVTAVTWTVEGEGVPAPAFDLEVVASGAAGETRHLAVFQGCGEDGYRWVGTPDEPADDPAVNVALVEADPDSPAPPVEEPAAEPTGEATAEPTDEPVAESTDEPTEEPTDDVAAEGPADDDGLSPVLLGGLVVVVLAALAVAAARRRRDGSAT